MFYALFFLDLTTQDLAVRTWACEVTPALRLLIFIIRVKIIDC